MFIINKTTCLNFCQYFGDWNPDPLHLYFGVQEVCIWLPQGGSYAVCSQLAESQLTLFEKVLPGYFLAHGLFLANINVYGHIMLKAPVLVRSLKLSNIESC